MIMRQEADILRKEREAARVEAAAARREVAELQQRLDEDELGENGLIHCVKRLLSDHLQQ
jgi:uncharacterized protein (DUF3084 family)